MNDDLEPLPSDDEFIAAVAAIVEDNKGRLRTGASANDVAGWLGVAPARRLGNGAVGGSWTGWMSASLRVSPRLRSLVSRGLLYAYHDRGEYRWRYRVPS